MPPMNTNSCTDGNPTPRAPRLPFDPSPRRSARGERFIGYLADWPVWRFETAAAAASSLGRDAAPGLYVFGDLGPVLLTAAALRGMKNFLPIAKRPLRPVWLRAFLDTLKGSRLHPVALARVGVEDCLRRHPDLARGSFAAEHPDTWREVLTGAARLLPELEAGAWFSALVAPGLARGAEFCPSVLAVVAARYQRDEGAPRAARRVARALHREEQLLQETRQRWQSAVAA